MADYVTRKLFPPIVGAKLDAFTTEKQPKLYFDVSMMNSRESFNHMQLSIHALNSNINALDRNTYPLGFLFIRADSSKAEGSNENQVFYDKVKSRYYINLPINWIKKIDETYKLQIRLGEQVISAPNSDGLTASDGQLMNQTWMNNPTNNLRFSEWSTICLIKPISKPTFGLQGFSQTAGVPTAPNQPNAITSNLFNFIGFYYPQDSNKSEVLNSYRIKIEGRDGGKPFVEDSGEKSIDEYNRAIIQYSPKRLLEEGQEYKITFSIKSKSGYEDFETYNGKVIYQINEEDRKKYQISVADQNKPKEYKNAIKVTLYSDYIENVDNFILKRTSHRSNFKKWEDIAVFDVRDGVLGQTRGNFIKELNYYDIFVESGVMYLYGLQPAMGARRGVLNLPPKLKVDKLVTDSSGNLVPNGEKVEINHAVAVEFDHSWMIGKGEKKLDITYGMQISSITRMIKESSVDTFGSKYPFITRNGNVNYRQFSLDGTITSYMDIANDYIPENLIALDEGYEDELMNPYEALYYQDYLSKNRIDGKDKYVVEREFRNAVDKVLHDGEPKVIKTDTEGMILIRLTGVTMTPKNELGRVIYDFSCTATEVGPVDLDTLMHYEIKKRIPVFPQIPDTVLPYVGQIYAGQTAPATVGKDKTL